MSFFVVRRRRLWLSSGVGVVVRRPFVLVVRSNGRCRGRGRRSRRRSRRRRRIRHCRR
jgi:hypothetical protein